MDGALPQARSRPCRTHPSCKKCSKSSRHGRQAQLSAAAAARPRVSLEAVPYGWRSFAFASTSPCRRVTTPSTEWRAGSRTICGQYAFVTTRSVTFWLMMSRAIQRAGANAGLVAGLRPGCSWRRRIRDQTTAGLTISFGNLQLQVASGNSRNLPLHDS